MKLKILILVVSNCILLQTRAQTDSLTVTLNQCIESALQNNPSIKRTTNEAAVSASGIKTAQSKRYPVLSSEASAGYSNEYRLNNDYKTGNAAISADQLIWQNGKANAVVNQAQYEFQAASYSLEAQKQQIILAVKTTFYTCWQEKQLYETATDNVSKANLFLEYARERYKTGSGRKSDVLKAESDLSSAEFERNRYVNAFDQSRNELSMLTGLPPDRFLNPQNIVRLEKFTNTKPSDSLRSAWSVNYPDLQIIASLQSSQEAKIKLAKAELYPRIGFSGGYTYSYTPIMQNQKGWYGLLTMRWQLFGGYAVRTQIKAEKIKKDMYENQSDEIKLFFEKEINNRIIDIREAESQIDLTNRLIKTTTENLDMAEAQYKMGTGSMLELADARINDLSARQNNIRAITAYNIALANLERLTGNMN